MEKRMILTVLAILLAIVVMSCGKKATMVYHEDDHLEDTYEVILIDSCEYIYVSREPYSREFALSHKGNCKYCKERAERDSL